MRREKRAICPFCNRQIRTLDSEYEDKEAVFGLSDGRRLGIRYVNLTRRTALCEEVEWQHGSSYLTARALAEVRRLFLDETGLNLVGLAA